MLKLHKPCNCPDSRCVFSLVSKGFSWNSAVRSRKRVSRALLPRIFRLNAFLNPEVGTISIMREVVHKLVDIREGFEFAAAHFFQASFRVFQNVPTTLLSGL